VFRTRLLGPLPFPASFYSSFLLYAHISASSTVKSFCLDHFSFASYIRASNSDGAGITLRRRNPRLLSLSGRPLLLAVIAMGSHSPLFFPRWVEVGVAPPQALLKPPPILTTRGPKDVGLKDLLPPLYNSFGTAPFSIPRVFLYCLRPAISPLAIAAPPTKRSPYPRFGSLCNPPLVLFSFCHGPPSASLDP